MITLSMIYRSWSSLRSRQLLRRLKTAVGPHEFGFIPDCENVEIWLVLQAIIEEAVLTGADVTGFVSDIVKAFECLPRQPVMWLGKRFGISREILQLWSHFLENMERRFLLSNQIGHALRSNSGFAERCGLSCVAIVSDKHRLPQLYESVHEGHVIVFRVQSRSPWRGVQQLHQGITTMEAWADMFHVELDKKKS